MVRTQIQIEEDQLQWLKKAASKKGISVSQMIRQGITLYREMEEQSPDIKRQRALAAIGRFSSGNLDISERHDEYLSDAFIMKPDNNV